MRKQICKCDGCDKDLDPKIQSISVRIGYNDANTTTISNDVFDLCESCKSRLLNSANPKTWLRSKKREPSADSVFSGSGCTHEFIEGIQTK